MKGHAGKNAWALFLLLLTGIVLGGFIGMPGRGSSGSEMAVIRSGVRV